MTIYEIDIPIEMQDGMVTLTVAYESPSGGVEVVLTQIPEDAVTDVTRSREVLPLFLGEMIGGVRKALRKARKR